MHILHNMSYFPLQGDWGKGGASQVIVVVLIDKYMQM